MSKVTAGGVRRRGRLGMDSPTSAHEFGQVTVVEKRSMVFNPSSGFRRAFAESVRRTLAQLGSRVKRIDTMNGIRK